MKVHLKLTRRWLLVGLLLAAAVMALLGPGFASTVRGTLATVLAPFGDGGMYLATALQGRLDRLHQRGISPEEAHRLQQTNQELQGRLQALEGELVLLRKQKEMLGRLYSAMPYQQWEFIPARVVGHDAMPYGQTRVVNAGSSQNAAPGQVLTTRRLLTDRSKALQEGLAAITGEALVGQVMEAGRFTARIRLVTDEGFSIRAKVLRMVDPDRPRTVTLTGENAEEVPLTKEMAHQHLPEVFARGNGQGMLIVREVNAYHNILSGDWLVTCGDDELLPVQIAIGQVADLRDDSNRPGLFVELHVKPSADLKNLREVYIVAPATSIQENND